METKEREMKKKIIINFRWIISLINFHTLIIKKKYYIYKLYNTIFYMIYNILLDKSTQVKPMLYCYYINITALLNFNLFKQSKLLNKYYQFHQLISFKLYYAEDFMYF